MKKQTFIIILVIGISCFIIYILGRKEIYQDKNDFTREVADVRLRLINAIDVPERYYFAGTMDKNIFLMYPNDMKNLYSFNIALKELDTLKIKYPATFYSQAKNIYKHVADSYIYCTNPYGDILVTNETKVESYKLKKIRFDFSQALSKNSMIVRVRESKNKSLAKITLNKQVVINKEYSFPNLANGAIANDGILFHDKRSNRILYMYYYRGEFLCLDTNLNLLYKAKTIDTVKTSNTKFKVMKYKEKGSKIYKEMIAQTTPPKIVNSYITTNNDNVYIISMLKADNETDRNFMLNQVIDVYDIRNGKYLHSFYVPKHLGKRLRQFLIVDNFLIGLNAKYIVQHKFNE